MEKVVDDILEQMILVRLEVRDLIRCKSVCKSWRNFISKHSFIKAHLNHSYKDDCHNNNFRHRRIVKSQCGCYSESLGHMYCLSNKCNIVGSSNGLVCISDFPSQVLIANPSTREFKILRNPSEVCHLSGSEMCEGFGYDSSSDDYKVVLGTTFDIGRTRFRVLSLKTDVWKHVGELKYMHIRARFVGTLCNGAIHWLMNESGDKTKFVIVSFDLSKEQFKEIPQPDDALYQCTPYSYLGIIDECLCICCPIRSAGSLRWVMKKYNVKESWTLFSPYEDAPQQ
ncbi:F-box protein CPR1-like protein, partial [Tanacetum coccineum]